MQDRQYIASLAGFAVGVVLALGGIVALLLWLGWAGAVPLVMIGGGALVYFYWGSRPDLRSNGRSGGVDRQRDA